MRKILNSIVVVSLVLAGSCDLSPSRAKLRYLQKGDKSYAAGHYDDALLNYRKAIQKDQNYGEAYFGLALSGLQQSKPWEAYASMSRAAELLPNREDVKAKFADLCLLLYLSDAKHPVNLYNQLTKLSEELLAKNPNSFDGLRIQGHLALSERKTAEAADFFRRANAAKPLQPEVILALTQDLVQLKQYAEAEKYALDLIPSHKSFGPIYDVLFNLYAATNRPTDAEKVLRAKADNNPKVGGYVTQLAAYYARVGKTAEMNAALQRLKDRPQDFPKAHLMLGDFYAGLGNLEEARRQLDEGAKADPKEAAVYQKRIANLYLFEGKKSDAAQLVDKLVEANPNDTGAQTMRATMLMETGNADKIAAALIEFKTLAQKNPQDATAHYNLGRAFLAQGDLESARGQFLESLKQRRDYLSPRFHLAEIGIRTRQYNDTVRYATEILAFQPDNPKAKLLRATAEAGLGKSKQAREELTNLIKEQPRFVDARLELGLAALHEKKFIEAEEIFRNLYKPGATDLRPLEGLVDVFAAQNEFDKALQLLDDELKRSPNSIAIRSDLAATAVRAGKLDLAIDQYQQLESSRPGVPDYLLRIGEAYFRKGDVAHAVDSVQKAHALAPKNSVVASYAASLLDRAGKKMEAIACYRQILEFRPDDPAVLNNLAFLLADSGTNTDEAMKLAEKAQKKMPDDPVVADTMGWIYLKRGMQQSAMHVFANLARKYPKDATYRYHYGLSLLENGEKKKARVELQSALANQPSKVEELRIKELIAKAGQ